MTGYKKTSRLGGQSNFTFSIDCAPALVPASTTTLGAPYREPNKYEAGNVENRVRHLSFPAPLTKPNVSLCEHCKQHS